MEYKEKIEFTKRLFLPLAIFLFILGFLFVFTFFYHENQHINGIAKKNSTRVFDDFDRKFKNDISMYSEIIKLISKDPKAINFFQTNNKDKLYEYFKPTFEDWKEKYNLTHFYFHKTNKINFLRVHNFNNSDDLISRTTLKNSIESKKLESGIEFGISNNLTLRVVYPWFVDNEIIGYIELGKEIDYFTPELAKLYDVNVIFTINKDLISKEDYSKWLETSKNNLKLIKLDNVYILDSTIKNFDKELIKALDRSDNLSNFDVSNFGKTFFINSKDFRDVDKNIIGKMIVLEEFTDENKLLVLTILQVSLLVGVLILMLLIYYFNLLKKEEITIESNQEKMMDLSVKDSLTGIYNRRYFDIYFDQILNNNTYINKYISLILIDIDNFKKYNDTYGHSKGDEVLINVATTMNNCLNRFNDKCFRIGGEEFAILLVSDVKEIAETFAEKIRLTTQELNLEHKNNENFNKVTISVGVYTKRLNLPFDKKQFFNEADKLLYLSKESGRNKISIEYEM